MGIFIGFIAGGVLGFTAAAIIVAAGRNDEDDE